MTGFEKKMPVELKSQESLTMFFHDQCKGAAKGAIPGAQMGGMMAKNLGGFGAKAFGSFF